MYATVKSLHVACAVISIGFFALRGTWMLGGSELLEIRAMRIAPHIVDTVLFLSAVTLSVLSGQYPLVHAWLTVKLLLLLAYIYLGLVALKTGRSRATRAVAFVGALLVFACIVLVAVHKTPNFF